MAKFRFDSADAAEKTFYAAFSATDLALMGELWLTGPQPTCIHPGGDLLQGYPAIMESWRTILGNGEAPMARFRVLERLTTPDLTIHIVEERIGRGGGGEDELTRILATNAYILTDDGWRMIMHHATLPLIAGGKRAMQPGNPRQVH